MRVLTTIICFCYVSLVCVCVYVLYVTWVHDWVGTMNGIYKIMKCVLIKKGCTLFFFACVFYFSFVPTYINSLFTL